jgi:DNA-directed RNA polymerase specialized sigma24 family protein
MTRSPDDRNFDRFRRTGDVRALAKVFDRVAPLLWPIATRLCADRPSAEDAVQNTFLVALENASES